MAAQREAPAPRRAAPRAAIVIALLLAGAAIHFARPILVPIALAILLAFVLGPVVGPLERRIGRVSAVAIVIVGLWIAVGIVAWGVARQITSFARELPQYRVQLRQRVAELRQATRDPDMTELQRTLGELLAEVQPGADQAGAVVVQGAPEPYITLSALTALLASAGLVTLLLAFVLLERQELRNRLIELTGHRRLAMTTKALDEASRRISHYLLSLTIVNVSFGACVSLGLFALGVPYALAWGVLAGLLRFIPFVGFWVALAVTALFSVATAPGWFQPAVTVALFLGLALALTFGLEPVLYGQSAGVSRVALVVGIALWTWLWGPVGLIIATPLTVCIIVLGRHVPELRYIAVLIGDEPVLPAPLRFYQRLLARDPDEAADVVENHLTAGPASSVYDEVLLPALSAAKTDRLRGMLAEADEQVVLRATIRIVRELSEVPAGPPDASSESPVDREPAARVPVLALPVHDGFDEVALQMLRQALTAVGADVEIASPELLSAEAVALAAQRRTPIVVIGSLQPGGHAQLRYLSQRLRRALPAVKIAAAAFAERGLTEASRESLRAAGADMAVTGIAEARDQMLPWIQLEQAAARATLAGGTRVA